MASFSRELMSGGRDDVFHPCLVCDTAIPSRPRRTRNTRDTLINANTRDPAANWKFLEQFDADFRLRNYVRARNAARGRIETCGSTRIAQKNGGMDVPNAVFPPAGAPFRGIGENNRAKVFILWNSRPRYWKLSPAIRTVIVDWV